MENAVLFLIIFNCFLGAIVIGIVFFYLLMRHKHLKSERQILHKKQLAEKELSASIEHPVMRYIDYKREFGSRARNIAIIGHSKNSDVLETIAEFTEKMRENGSFVYHFTNYWGNADLKETQRMVTDVIQSKYDGIFIVGTALTKLARSIGITNNSLTPIVFTRVTDDSWQREQKKKVATHMTGITVKDSSDYRIRMYLTVKPFMKSALIPITHQTFADSAQKMAQILNNYGVTAHAIRVHGTNELINVLSQYRDKIDSLIITRDIISPELCMLLAQKCSEHSITFFSPFLKDIFLGAAVALSTINEHFGYNGAQRMLALIEEGKVPADLPITSIDQSHTHELHFNQMAMQTQGLDCSRITTVALQYGAKIYATLEKDIES